MTRAQAAVSSADDSGVRRLSSEQPALCLHCRSPLASDQRDGFCCAGCRNVHTLLQSSGLDRYYQLRGENTLAPVSAVAHQRDHAWLDALIASFPESGARRFALDVQGIQCGACVWLIEALFKRQPGRLSLQLNPALGRLSCVVSDAFPLRQFVEQIEEFGYRLGPAQRASGRARDGLLLRTGICAALAGNTMFLGAATYLGLDTGPLHTVFQSASFVTASLSALIGGSYFVERALAGLKRGVLHLDLPIAVGMGLAYLGSALSHWFGGGSAAYFDTVSVFIALMLLGRVVQERLVEKNRRQLLETDGARGLIARRLRDGRTEFVACQEIAANDRLLICPGELVPVASRLEQGPVSVSLDWITGESEPQQIGSGQPLLAGAVNVGSSAFEVVASTPFQSSELDLLMRSDDSAKQRRSGEFWDRTARLYVVGVLLATLGSVVSWAALGASLVQILDVATAVLVVTCPCAFGIAVPLAYELGVSGLRTRGLFVRDAGFFDRAARVRRIVFDKTGTLTTGIPALQDPDALDELSDAERSLLYALVARSNHPKSTAIARALESRYPSLRAAQVQTREIAGKGVTCEVEGVVFRLGEPSWALGREVPHNAPCFSADGQLLLALPLSEVARPHAEEELRQLERAGYELWIASGDHAPRVARMAETLGIAAAHALGDLTPGDKLALIERLDRQDTLMLGDGINDGPALARAHCSGTPAIDRPFVPSRADFYFLTPGLMPVRLSLQVARAVRGTVHKALWFAGLYNVGAVALAYAGWMRPWLAAVLMPASSVAVLIFTASVLSTRSQVWRS